MRKQYNTITITASAVGVGVMARQFARVTLKEALSNYEAFCDQLLRDNLSPDGTYFRYRDDAMWSIESIALS
jgi:hypothetical protein